MSYKVIAYPFPVFCSPCLKFLGPVVSFSLHLLREFLLLERSTCVHSRCQEASTNCPRTDIDTTLRHHYPKLLTRLLPVFLHSLTKKESSRPVVSLFRPHLPFLTAINSLPPEIFLRIRLTDEALTFSFPTMSLPE